MSFIGRDITFNLLLCTSCLLVLLTNPIHAQHIIHTCTGDSVLLASSLPGIAYEWSPEPGVANPFQPYTMAKVQTSTSYICTVYQVLDNLIVNANFNQGDRGFRSDYAYNPSAQFGRYYVTDQRTDSWWNGFSPCFDHTTGQDSMLLVDGASVPDARVWCQDIRVQPNTTYAFSCWIQNICTCGAPPRLQFAINGTKLGNDFLVTTINCFWTQFYELWESGSDTLATICILNQNLDPDGNDFALDDIGFQPIQLTFDTIQVITDAPLPVGQQNIGLCPGASFPFNGQLYDQPGSYVDTLRGLPACDSIVMTLLKPVDFSIDAGPDLEIENGETIQLAVQGPILNGLSWSWTPAEHLSCTDCPGPQASPDETTTYRVEVSDPATGCIAMDELNVRVVPCRRIYFPNAFSPDGDGLNDRFTPFFGSCVRQIRTLRVLDRWGDLVYEQSDIVSSNNMGDGWDGNRGQQKMPPGVYVYQALIEYGNNTTAWLTGDVTLIR